MAALEGVNVTAVSGCETASITCAAYSAISPVEDEAEYNIANTVGSSTLCLLSTAQCDYVYYEGVSSITGSVVYEVEPASCLLIPWWSVTIIVVIGLIVIGLLILVSAYLILRWLDYCQLMHFQKEVQEDDSSRHVNRAYQPLTVTYESPLQEEPM